MNLEELDKQRWASLQASEKAIMANPSVYKEIKRLAKDIVYHTVDISDYYCRAMELTELLQTLKSIQSHSIFSFFLPHIDPRQLGRPKYLRGMCKDMLEQMDQLDAWRRKQHKLTVVK